jgi:hypothetical protein
MKIDWNATAVTIDHEMNLHDVCGLILELTHDEQHEVIVEVLCNWDDAQRKSLNDWLEDF